MWHQHTTLNIGGKLISLETPTVMGIINTTPDSFYKDSRTRHIEDLLIKVETMLDEGATFIDIGGASSRPGAEAISEQEEMNRILPAIEAICKRFDCIISIDTYRANVAKEAIALGAGIINDISGGDLDDKMFDTVAELEVPYILMHMPGTPKTMQRRVENTDVTKRVLDSLIEKTGRLRALEVKDIIIDPGFGFGKSLEQNYELLNRLHVLKLMELPILVGISRKSCIYKPLDISPEQALNGTTALHVVALQQGASILRVHDVKEAVEVIHLFELLKNNP